MMQKPANSLHVIKIGLHICHVKYFIKQQS